jgi:Cofactor assembly of complex C subunit B
VIEMKINIFLLSIVATASEAFIVSRPATSSRLLDGKALNAIPIEQLSIPAVADFMDKTSTALISAATDFSAPPESDGISYSKASYYTVLGLYLMSFPGLWSIVKRSTAAKVKRKTYVTPGEKSTDANAKGLRQQAGEIMACKFRYSQFYLSFF